MKCLFTFLLLFFFCISLMEGQQLPTYAGLPGPENVLVVYKKKTSTTDTLGMVSDSVMRYYKLARGIPAVNIVGLS